VPAAQLLHTDAPAAEKVPAAQFEQLDAADKAEYIPMAQLTQVVDIELDAYFPAGQRRHAVVPVED